MKNLVLVDLNSRVSVQTMDTLNEKLRVFILLRRGVDVSGHRFNLFLSSVDIILILEKFSGDVEERLQF